MKNLFCLLIVLLIPVAAFSQTGEIEGTVYNKNTDKPFPGIDVHLIESTNVSRQTKKVRFLLRKSLKGSIPYPYLHQIQN